MLLFINQIAHNLDFFFSTSNFLVLSLCLAFKREAAEQKDKVKDDKEEKKRLEAEKKEQKEREKKEQEARKKFKVSEKAWNSVELAITPRRSRPTFGDMLVHVPAERKMKQSIPLLVVYATYMKQVQAAD